MSHPAASRQLDRRHALRALHRLVAQRRRDRVHLEPRAERGSVLQLRPLHAEGRATSRSGGSRPPRTPSTVRAGHPTARRSPTRPPNAASPISRRRWRIRTSGRSTPTGTNRRELGRGIDNRQGAPQWTRRRPRGPASPCRSAAASHLYRLPLTCQARPGRRSLAKAAARRRNRRRRRQRRRRVGRETVVASRSRRRRTRRSCTCGRPHGSPI